MRKTRKEEKNLKPYEKILMQGHFEEAVKYAETGYKQYPVISTKKEPETYSSFGCFDIETSHVSEDITESFCYLWQFTVGENDTVVFGRTLEEFKEFIDELCERCTHRMVMYVHNLSFEFGYIRSYLEIDPNNIFFTDNRKPAYFTYRNILFRDSLLLTNMSLDQFTKKYNAVHTKQSGQDFNYQEIRLPSTPLTDEQYYYGACDVLGLKEALVNLLRSENDDLLTVPMTSTGYVRRDVRKAMTNSGDIKKVRGKGKDPVVFDLLRSAFRGGNTHANRFYTGRIIDNVDSADRSSSYPDVLINRKYPIADFKPMEQPTVKHTVNVIDKGRFAVLFRIKCGDIEIRDILDGFPYLSSSKCESIVDAIEDNGRILKASYLETVITDIDFRIIRKQYRCKHFQVADVYISRYEYLPESFVECVREYYRKKTELKNVDGQEIYYMKSKNKLNALFGMCCTNNIKGEIQYNPMDDEHPFKENELTPEEKQAKLNEQARNNFLLYQWGVWCTAYAREALQWGLDLAGHKAIYCDTDSVKYEHDDDVSENLQHLSVKLREDSRKRGAFATDPKGETHYMGVYEDDGHYKRFATLGAKKYAYEDEKGFHITIAGVPKKEGAKEMGCIENFVPLFAFRDTGKKVRRYNDHIDPITYEVTDVYGNTELVDVRSNIDLRETTYILNITEDYDRVVNVFQMARNGDAIDRRFQSLRYGGFGKIWNYLKEN